MRTDNGMLTLEAERSLAELPDPDVIVVPGGPGEVAPRAGEAMLDVAFAPPTARARGRPRSAPAR